MTRLPSESTTPPCCRIARMERIRCWFVPMRPVTPFMIMPTRLVTCPAFRPCVGVFSATDLIARRDRKPTNGRAFAESGPRRSIGFRARGFDHLAPFGRLGLHEGAEILPEHRSGLAAELVNTFDHVRILQNLRHFLTQLGEDRRRRRRRRDQTEP